jgi:hypothetical protein
MSHPEVRSATSHFWHTSKRFTRRYEASIAVTYMGELLARGVRMDTRNVAEAGGTIRHTCMAQA